MVTELRQSGYVNGLIDKWFDYEVGCTVEEDGEGSDTPEESEGSSASVWSFLGVIVIFGIFVALAAVMHFKHERDLKKRGIEIRREFIKGAMLCHAASPLSFDHTVVCCTICLLNKSTPLTFPSRAGLHYSSVRFMTQKLEPHC